MKYYLKGCEVTQEIWDYIKFLEKKSERYEQTLNLISTLSTFEKDTKTLAKEALADGQNFLKNIDRKVIDNLKEKV